MQVVLAKDNGAAACNLSNAVAGLLLSSRVRYRVVKESA